MKHDTKSKGENLLKGPGGRPGVVTPGNQLLGLSGPKYLIFRLAEECTARKVLTSAPLLTTPPPHTHTLSQMLSDSGELGYLIMALFSRYFFLTDMNRSRNAHHF